MSAIPQSIFLLIFAVAGVLSLPTRSALQSNLLSRLESEDAIPEGRGEDDGPETRDDPDSMVPQIPLPAAFEGDGHSRIDSDVGEPPDGYPSIKSPLLEVSDPDDDEMFDKRNLFNQEILGDERGHIEKIPGMQSFLKDGKDYFGQEEETQVAEYPIGSDIQSDDPGNELKMARRGSAETEQEGKGLLKGDEMHYEPYGDYLPFAGGELLQDDQGRGDRFQPPQETDDSHEQNLEKSSSELFSDPDDFGDKDSPQDGAGENLGSYDAKDDIFDKNYIV